MIFILFNIIFVYFLIEIVFIKDFLKLIKLIKRYIYNFITLVIIYLKQFLQNLILLNKIIILIL